MTQKTPPPVTRQIPLQAIDAGDFATWLAGTHATQVEGRDADVPCGTCNGCCKSFYFIHVTPDDTRALGAIPNELLFSAPGLPSGHYVMGYDDQGHCPMLRDDRCSIYRDRPQTCRAYDCRIFAAAEMAPGETDKTLVADRTKHWEFSYASNADRAQRESIARAARWLEAQRENSESHLPKDFIPSNSTQLAVLALQLHPLFGANIGPEILSSKAHAQACVAKQDPQTERNR